MSPGSIVDALELTILRRSLNLSERQVLIQSFQGYSYDKIAENFNYTSGYLKVVGAKLWQELSEVLGQKVTKKNAYALLTQRLSHEVARQPQHQQFSSPSILFGRKAAFVGEDWPCPSGPLSLGSPFYVERPPLERHAYREIERPGCLLRLKAPRRYGKSSLLLRILARANHLDFRTVVLDFQDADRPILADLNRLLRWVCANIARQLGLTIAVNDCWDADLGSKVSYKAFLQEQVLSSATQPLLIVFNEVNQVFEYSQVAQDFLPLLRSCHEQSKTTRLWQKLRLVMAYSTEIYVPLRLNQSPFNVGTALCLPAFNLQQVCTLADKYGLKLLEAPQMPLLMKLLGGHPYLVNLAFSVLKDSEVTFDQLVEMAPTPSGVYGAHLQRYRALLLDQPDLARALAAVIRGTQTVELDTIAAYKLASIGLVRLEGYTVSMSCELYRFYFERIFDTGALSI